MNMQKKKTQKNVQMLIQFISRGKSEGKNLSELFSDYAKKTGKAKGSIRNRYYEIAALAQKDDAFRQSFMGETLFSVQKKRTFTGAEEEGLLLRLFTLKRKGVSVRQALALMAKGNPTLALRYQNKYRNLLTKNPGLVLSAVERVKGETGYCFNPYEKRKAESFAVKQSEKSALAKKLLRLKAENAKLKEKLLAKESTVQKAAAALTPTPTNVPTLSTQTKKQA